MKFITQTPFIACLGISISFAQAGQEREDGDFNFDGHPDYRIQSEQPGNQCGGWEYFLFDPDTNEYRHVETALCKEQFDDERKLVTTRVNGGMAGLVYTIRHFRWDGSALVVVYAEAQDYDSDRRVFVRTRVTNIDSLAGPSIYTEILTPTDVDASHESLN